ncbi:MAG: carboxypeptidase regulatory-like domain-containing protein [Candidatus Binatia bacterium]
MRTFWILLMTGAVALHAVPAVAYEAGEVKNGGTIAGVAIFDGQPPSPKKLAVTKDQEVCGTEKIAEDLVVGADGKIAHVVVSLTDVKKGKKMGDAAPVLDQRGCRYLPHVLLVPAGSTVKVLNNDGILHNVHTYARKNQPVNIAQPKFKKEITTEFEEPELVSVKCDTHEWMSGVIVVMDHPYYATSDETGAFRLTDVPPGEYSLKAWHEKLGEKLVKVKVEAGTETRVELKLGGK